MGGFQTISNSVRSLKQHERQVIVHQNYLAEAEINIPIIFGEADTKNMAMSSTSRPSITSSWEH
ncbi:unnamed protein product [Arabis nemorensis]|uniref:Uncharacterized protein n=1 Tax=Arabis nemorensis TaxID=586526 RepID=A0A565CCN6_9BRAS|nr:unnamed protein product [Arabis nemorensis]